MAGFLDFLWNGKPPPSVTNNVNSSTNIPDWFQDYQKGVLAKGNAISAEPYQTYTGPRQAGFTPDQTQAYSQVRSNQGNWQPALAQANQYTTAAGGPFNQEEFNSYLSPYTNGVINRIADLGQRNLSENLLPQVNDTFTGAGQFGSTNHADITGRTVRDANESILGQQSLALQQSYDSAMGNYQTAQGRKLQAGEQMGALGQTQQQLGTQDAAALEAIGQTQQQQNQGGLDLAYQDFQNQKNYPAQQTDWLNNLLKGTNVPTSTASTTTGPGNNFQPSGLSQLAGIYSLLKGMKEGGRVTPALAVHKHERRMHPGKALTALRRGGPVRMASGGALNFAYRPQRPPAPLGMRTPGLKVLDRRMAHA